MLPLLHAHRDSCVLRTYYPPAKVRSGREGLSPGPAPLPVFYLPWLCARLRVHGPRVAEWQYTFPLADYPKPSDVDLRSLASSSPSLVKRQGAACCTLLSAVLSRLLLYRGPR